MAVIEVAATCAGFSQGRAEEELRVMERMAREMGLADLLAEVLDEPDELGI